MIFIPAALTEASMGAWLNSTEVAEDKEYHPVIFSDDFIAYEDWLVQNNLHD